METQNTICKSINHSRIKEEYVVAALAFVLTAVTSIFVKNAFYTFFCAVECIAVYEDVKEKQVYDLIHIIAAAPMIIYCIGHFGAIAENAISLVVPFLFVVLTWSTRGASDGILMVCEIIFFATTIAHGYDSGTVTKNINYITILLVFLIGYLIQISIHTIDCIKNKKKWNEKGNKAFIPALLFGFEIICVTIFI